MTCRGEILFNAMGIYEFNDLNIAVREAGRVAVYFADHRAIRKVMIISNDDVSEGYCYGYDRKLPLIKKYEITPKIRDQVERKIMIFLAGGIAINRFMETKVIEKEVDNQALSDLTEYMVSSDEEAEAYVNWLYIRTQNLFAKPGVWPFIEALTTELLKEHTLSGKEAKAIWDAQLMDHSTRPT